MTRSPSPTQPWLEAHPRLAAGDRLWHKSAPSGLRKAIGGGDFARGWRAWSRHLSERSGPAYPDDLLAGGETSLHWGLPPQWRLLSPEMLGAGRSAAGAEPQVLAWLGEVAGGTPGVEDAIETLAFCRHLPRLSERLSPDAWFALLAHLIDAVGDAGTIDPDPQPLLAQLLGGELPLTLAYLFPELVPCRALARGAKEVLSAGLTDLLDGEGLLHGRQFALMRPLLACWTRCRVLSNGMKPSCFTAPARRQYEYMVRHVLRFARHDGSAMLGPAMQEGDADLLRTAVAVGGSAVDRTIAALTLPAAARDAGRKPKTDAARPQPAAQSEWAAVALLRTDWSRTSERLAVVYPGQTVQMELGCGKEVLLSGPWSLDVALDGERLAPHSDWEQVCWVADDDVEYLELQIELDAGVRVQRQIALAREDRFLFLADAVLGEQPGKLEYRSCLPLGAGIDFRPAKESREGYLQGAKRRALVFPLALAEWRSLWSAGELQAVAADGGGPGLRGGTPAKPGDSDGKPARTGAAPVRALELTHAAKAARLYAPLFFDLNRRRFERPYTWRRLTVAEALEVQPDDVAVGYRIAVGRSQWLVYRSLAPRGNRTLLGHNLSTEAMLAHFDSSGEVKPLVEVE